MNFLRRAWLSVTRRKGKSLLLFALIFIIANVIAGALSIQQASKRVEDKIKSNMGAIASIEPDHELLQKEYAKDSNFTFDSVLDLKTIEQVGQSSYVKYYDYNVSASLGSEELQFFVPDFFKEQAEEGNVSFNSPGEQYYAFRVNGVQYPKILDIEEKKVSLVDGRVLTQEEVDSGKPVGLISKQIAELNNIKLGDTINLTLYNIIYDSSGESDEPKSESLANFGIEVVGIFDGIPVEAPKSEGDSSAAQGQQDEWQQAFTQQMIGNTIYTPNKLALEINQAMYDSLDMEDVEGYNNTPYYTPIYVLNKPEDVDKFKEENKALIPKYFTIVASSDQYDTIAAPVQAMSKLAGYVLWVAILAAILIITLVVLLFLRDRKHELGIYLSFGEEKGKVFGQILVEVVLIAFLAISLALVTGNFIANSLSGSLIQQQLENQDMMGGMMYISGPLSTTNYTTDDVVSAYKVALTPFYALLMYGVGLGTTLLATLVPMAYILRLNPKKIMM